MPSAPHSDDAGPSPSDDGAQAGGSAPSASLSLARRAARIARWLAVAAALLLAIGALLYATRERSLHPLLVRFAPPIVRVTTGLQLELTDIDGDWRKELSVEGFHLDEGDADRLGALESVDVASASVRGDLIGLVRGRTTLDQLEFVRLDRPVVRLDLTEGSAKPESSGSGQPNIPALPEVTIQDGSVALKLGGDTLRFTDVQITGRGSEEAPLQVGGEAAAASWQAVIAGEVRRKSSRELAFAADVPKGSARGVDLTLKGFAGTWSPSETTISAGTLVIGENYASPENVVLRRGATGLEAGGRLAFDLQDVTDAHRAALAFQGLDQPATWKGQLRGTVDLTPSPTQIATGNIALSGEDLTVAGIKLGVVSAFATADESGVKLHEALASDGNGCVVRGKGALLADRQTLKDVQLSVQLDAPETIYPALRSVRGLLATVTLNGDRQDPSGSIDLSADSFDAGGTLLQDIAAKGTLEKGVLSLSDVALGSKYGDVVGTAQVGLPIQDRPLDLLVQTLSWRNRGAELALSEPVPIVVSDGRVQIDGLSLTSGEGAANLSFDSASDEGLALDLVVNAIELEPFTGMLSAAEGLHFGALDGNASFRSKSASSGEPAGSIDLTLQRSADLSVAPVAARLRAAWRGGRIDLEDVVVELDAAQLQLQGSAPLALTDDPLGPGPVELQGRLGADAEALRREPLQSLFTEEQRTALQRASGRAFANVRLDGSWSALRGTLNVDLENAKLDPKEGAEPWLPEALTGSLALRLGDTIELDPSGLSLGKTAKAVVEGSLDQSLDASAMLRDPAARIADWRQSDLQLTADLDFQSLSWLARFLPELRETSGQLSGALSVTGSVDQPESTGVLTLVDGAARYRGFPPLENLQLEVRLDPGQVRLERADMEVGAAPVSISGSILHGQGNPRVDVTIKGTEVLLARSSEARIRADLDLRLTGRTNALAVGGDVFLAGGRIRSPIEFQGLLAGGTKSPSAVRRGIRIPSFGPESVKLDLKIKTKEPLALKGRIARGSIRADLRLTGSAQDPQPLGQVFFDPLELAVPAGSIRFPTGIIRFDPDSPDIPRIDLVGSTRLAGYDVTVNVDGDYDEPNVELSSSPPLAPEDLLLLVLSGQPPARGGGIEAAGQSVALYVAKDLVRGWFSSGGFEDEDKESFLDRLEVTSGRDVSRTGTLTLEATYKIREGLARKRDAIYVVLERDAYEDYGLGLRLVVRLR